MVVNMGVLINVYVYGNDGIFFDNYFFNYFRVCVDEVIIFNDGWVSLQWFQYVVDVYVIGKVDVFINLCIRIDGCLGINYGVFINICVDVDVRWYQYGVMGNKCILMYCCWWYNVEVFFLEMCFVVVGEFYWYFVEVVVFCFFDYLIIINMEREQYCFF